ncbi:MAG: hypothetical protein MUC64_19185 [Rubritepida sp.]|nr:hypothetical protein [Rubritepida sp.]
MDGSSHAAPLSLEAAELEYQCLVAERAHFDAALAAWNAWRRLGLAIALLTAATTGSAMEVVGLIPGFGGEFRAALTGSLALLLALCTAAFAFLDPKGLRDRHDLVGKRLAGLRAEVRLLRRDPGGAPRAAFEALLARHAEILAEAPPISDARHEAVKTQLASNVHYKELRALTGRKPPKD